MEGLFASPTQKSRRMTQSSLTLRLAKSTKLLNSRMEPTFSLVVVTILAVLVSSCTLSTIQVPTRSFTSRMPTVTPSLPVYLTSSPLEKARKLLLLFQRERVLDRLLLKKEMPRLHVLLLVAMKKMTEYEQSKRLI